MSSTNENTLAREYAFKFLFHLSMPQFQELRDDLTNEDNIEVLQKSLSDFENSYSEPDKEHPDNELSAVGKNEATKLIEFILSNYEDVVSKISENLNKRKFANLDKVESTILLVGTSEFLFKKETPPKVIIDESIRLAKKYGSEDSYAFVNGVLDAILKSEK